MSEYVPLCRPLPGAVVTYFVTGSRTSSLRNTRSLVLLPRARQDHSGMTGESGAGTGIGGRALEGQGEPTVSAIITIPPLERLMA